ncbi:MAG: NAD-dependent epimerase/dehydratase family protein [Deltaproteobacteria bacterium]|nr:NAD-dependent epimerase/dehydratase family protein [Deltaproteobacteria bacterium]
MKVLVTGASGFLGRHLLAALHESPAHEVVGLCRRPERLGDVPVSVLRSDLLAPDGLAEHFAGFDAVVHAAGSVSHEARDAGAMYDAHVRATEHTVAAAQEAGVRRLLVLSSSGTIAVSDRDETLDETAPSPLSFTKGWPYYRAKLFAEQSALAASSDTLDVVVLNPSLLLGPTAPAPFDVGSSPSAGDDVLLPLLRGQLPVAPGGGISFVDVRDVARTVVRALGHGHPNRRYLLVGANWTFADFYARAGRAAGVRGPGLKAPRFGARLLSFLPKIAQDRLPASPVELEMASHFWWADSTRARKELEFAPREPLDTLTEAVMLARRALDGEDRRAV